MRALALPHAAERPPIYLAALLLGDCIWDVHCRDQPGERTRTACGRCSSDGYGDGGAYENLFVSVRGAVARSACSAGVSCQTRRKPSGHRAAKTRLEVL